MIHNLLRIRPPGLVSIVRSPIRSRTVPHLPASIAKPKGHSTMYVMGSYAAKEGLHDGLPTAEGEGYRDEDDLAEFGKRPQLKVRPPSPWTSALKAIDSEILASFQWLV